MGRLRISKGLRKYTIPVTLVMYEKVEDAFGHASYKTKQVKQVQAFIQQMSMAKQLATYQSMDVIGLEIELRNPGEQFNGLLWNGKEVHFSSVEETQRGFIFRINGYYQQDH